MVSVFTSVRNMWFPPCRSAGRRLHRSIVARWKAQRERGAAADRALQADGAVELFDDPFRDREPEPEAASLGCDELVEDRGEPFGRDARSGVADADLDAIPGARRRDGDRAAGRRRLNGIGDEIAVHAPE